MDLNYTDEQKRIFHFVETEHGHGIIDAVAGAGKTSTIIECARYVADQKSVLFCAFNNSIAAEIAQKFKGRGMYDVTVKTIHALGRQILDDNNNTGKPIGLENKKYRQLLKLPEVVSQLRPHYSKILKLNNLDPEETNDRQIFAVNGMVRRIDERLLDINQKYRSTLTRDDLLAFGEMVAHYNIFNEVETKKKDFREELTSYFEAHKILLNEGNTLSKKSMIIDFTDMLYLPVLWNMAPVKKFMFLFIDECQDLSRSQLAIASKYGKKEGRILAVGDPKQSIYGFTGADIKSFDTVKEKTQATSLPLTVCFRCPQRVIQLAREIRTDIKGNKQEQGLIYSITFDEVVSRARPGDLIISRLKAPLVILVFNFIDKDIKIEVHPDEVAEIIRELRDIFKPNELNQNIASLENEFDDIKKEVLKRWSWIIKNNASRIIDSTERAMQVEAETHFLEQKLNFLERKYHKWKNGISCVDDILKRIKDFITSKVGSVKLSTIHRAKGLENDRVFIINYDQLPYFRLEQKDWERVQEVNLKYVAITRAKKELILVESKTQEEIENEESLFDSLALM